MKRPTLNAQRPTPNVSRSSGTPLNIGRWALILCLLVSFTACDKPGISAPPPQPLKKLYEVAPFTLTERSGEPFHSQTMLGKVWVANFFFVDCIGICLEMNKQTAKIHREFASSGEVQFVSISTEEKDTPEKLREYATQLGADNRWHFLTGKKEQVFDICIQGFKLPLKDDEVNVEHRWLHSTRLVLMDRKGWVRGYYDSLGEKAEQDAARLVADIKRLQAEPVKP